MSSLLHAVRTSVSAVADVTEAVAKVAVDVSNEVQTFTKEGLHEFTAGMSDVARSFRFEQRVNLRVLYTGKELRKEYKELNDDEWKQILEETKKDLNIQ